MFWRSLDDFAWDVISYVIINYDVIGDGVVVDVVVRDSVDFNFTCFLIVAEDLFNLLFDERGDGDESVGGGDGGVGGEAVAGGGSSPEEANTEVSEFI